MEIEQELADEIYIFISKNMKGLKFIDRSPSKVEQKFAGQLPEGVFYSDIHSMSQAEWNDDINEPNGTKIVHYRDGSNNSRTYMVSEEKFQEILQSILKAKNYGDEQLVIDTREKEKKQTKDKVITSNNIMSADEKSKFSRQEIFNSIQELNQYKENEKDISDKE